MICNCLYRAFQHKKLFLNWFITKFDSQTNPNFVSIIGTFYPHHLTSGPPGDGTGGYLVRIDWILPSYKRFQKRARETTAWSPLLKSFPNTVKIWLLVFTKTTLNVLIINWLKSIQTWC